jgi:hypothetical protein
MGGYPEHLAGEPAPAPEDVPARLLAMAAKAHGKHLAAVADQLVTAAPWRLAGCLEVLRGEADATAPNRRRASDGTIGDARHQLENGPHGPGSGSDHNPWVILAGQGIVRAFDVTNDPVLALPTVFERIRAQAAAGSSAAGARRRLRDPERADHRRRTGRGGASTRAPTRTCPTGTCPCRSSRPRSICAPRGGCSVLNSPSRPPLPRHRPRRAGRAPTSPAPVPRCAGRHRAATRAAVQRAAGGRAADVAQPRVSRLLPSRRRRVVRARRPPPCSPSSRTAPASPPRTG